MVNSAHIQKYLQRLQDKYQQWWKLYGLIDEEYEPFDFRVEVQTEEPIQEGALTQHSSEKKTILLPFPVLDGIDRYVAKEPVLIVGQPGSGKSTALVRFLLKSVEQAHQDPLAPIPVLVELRRYKTQSGTLTLIQDSFKRFGLKDADLEELRVAERPFLLLLDGLNELPSKQALTDLRNFREDCSDLGIPIVVTTRALDGDNLGIKRQLEIKSLTPSEIQRFLQTCLPQESKQRFQELSDRLRELGQTPLMLWMLYTVLKEPQGQIPNSRGELFRRFIQIYERKREEKIYLDEDNKLDSETRRWWTRLLKPLAFEMMRSGKSGEPTDFRLEILKRDAETICKDFLKAQALDNYSDLAIRCLDALIKHHLIQLDPEKQDIEFCHQLIQEYHAAEWLREQLPELSDEQLKYYFLNNLKWTEAIGLMLGLIDENDFGGRGREQATRVVEIALKVDLMLGARLAGKVKSQIHAQTVSLVNELEDIADTLNIQLLRETRLDEAIPKLVANLKGQDYETQSLVISALGNIDSDRAIDILLDVLQEQDPKVCQRAIDALGKTGNDRVITPLLDASHHENPEIRRSAIDALKEIGNEAVFDRLCSALKEDQDSDVRSSAAQALEKIGGKRAIYPLLHALRDEELSVFWDAANSLGTIGGEQVINLLIEWMQLNKSTGVAQRAVFALARIESEETTECLIQMLNHEDVTVRGYAASGLGKIGCKQAVPGLLKALQKEEDDMCSYLTQALGEIGGEQVVAPLLQILNNQNHPDRFGAALALGKIGGEQVVETLLVILQDEDEHEWVRGNAAEALGEIGSEKALKPLLKALKDENDSVRRQASEALGKIGNKQAIEPLFAVLKNDESAEVRSASAEALGKLGNEQTIEPLVDALNDEDFDGWLNVTEALGKIGSPKFLERLWQLHRTTFDLHKTIAAIQERCQFYNYEIAQSDPPPTVRQDSGVGKQERTINNFNIETLNANNSALNLGGMIQGDQISNQRLSSNSAHSTADRPDSLSQTKDVLEIIFNTGLSLERSSRDVRSLPEESLRDFFIPSINARYSDSTTPETRNKNGKTDILVRIASKNILIVECKFWGGDEKLKSTLDQLLNRYTTVRDTQLAMLIFSRNKQFTDVKQKIPVVMKEHPSFIQEMGTDLEKAWYEYVVSHPDDRACELNLTVLAFHLSP